VLEWDDDAKPIEKAQWDVTLPRPIACAGPMCQESSASLAETHVSPGGTRTLHEPHARFMSDLAATIRPTLEARGSLAPSTIKAYVGMGVSGSGMGD
jgi:hypothetical protein